MTLLRYALAYASSGKPVFPCHLNKKPMTANGFKDATTDPDIIRKWWTQNPKASIGLPTGKLSELFVLDVDLPLGPETLAKLEAEYGLLPETLEQRTGSGGRHLFFSHPGPKIPNSVKKLGADLDIRGDGGYIIVPPSEHPSGHGYKWLNKCPIAEAPAWLLSRVAERSNEFHYSQTKASQYGQNALDSELAVLTSTSEGSRNHQLNLSAFSLGQLVAGGLLSSDQVKAELLAAAVVMGLPCREAEKTIQSGMEAGKREPRIAPPLVVPWGRVKGGEDNSDKSYNSQYGEKTQIAWPVLDVAALPGIVGNFVAAACENSEADPAAVLATFLVRFGVQCGSGPHFMVGDSKHYVRLNAIIAGESSKSRKGTSAGPVDVVFDVTQSKCRLTPGPLSTGEGIIFNVRDEQKTWMATGKPDSGSWQVTDPGVSDKRLFVMDQEFAAALQSTKRNGNTLSSVIRTLFDSGNAEPLTKSNRTKTSGAHVGIVSHITIGELRKLLSENEQINGFGNRFLWVCAKRPKLVPFPQPLDEKIKDLIASHIDGAVASAQTVGCMTFSQGAKGIWAAEYRDLSEAMEGNVGSMVSRAEALVLRLAMTYALLAKRNEIDVEDLTAALAFWGYCKQSALYLFAGNTPITKRTKKILEIIDAKGGAASRSELLTGLGGHTKAEALDELLADLATSGLITIDHVQPEGGTKPTTIVKKCELSE